MRTAEEKDRKICEIVNLIAKHGMLPPDMRAKLARKWHMDEGSVSHLMADAFRLIRLSRGTWEQELDAKLLQLEADRRTALRLKRPLQHKDGTIEWYRAPDCKAAIRATEVYLHAIGAMVRKDQRKHPEGSLQDLKQKRDAVRSALGDLEAVIEQKEGEVH